MQQVFGTACTYVPNHVEALLGSWTCHCECPHQVLPLQCLFKPQMSENSLFEVKTYVLPCQHVREYQQALLDNDAEPAFEVKRYVPRQPSAWCAPQNAVAIIAAGGIGMAKVSPVTSIVSLLQVSSLLYIGRSVTRLCSRMSSRDLVNKEHILVASGSQMRATWEQAHCSMKTSMATNVRFVWD